MMTIELVGVKVKLQASLQSTAKQFGLLLISSMVSFGNCQVNFSPSSLLGYIGRGAIDDYVLAPYDMVYDSDRPAGMPKNFRSPVFYKPAKPQDLNNTGFNQLTISGSAQYSWPELQEMVKYVHNRHKVPYDHIYVLDLREEPHGFFNDAAVSWYYGPLSYQQNKETDAVIASELRRIEQVRSFPNTFAYKVKKTERGVAGGKSVSIEPVRILMREREAVLSLGAQYKRLPVTDHFRPQSTDIDDFVDWVKTLPQNAWIHMKCRGGKGRTTTFMALFDIIQNPKVPVDSILERHKLLGGVDLSRKKIKKGQEWKLRLNNDRVNIIKHFYAYRNAPESWGKIPFSTWIIKQGIYLGYLGEKTGTD